MGADGVHLGQDDLDSGTARRILGDALVGRSTHAEGEILAAGADPARLDYIAVGPVWTTPTKPGRPAVGLELVRYAADRAVLPWFAIGGVDRATLPAVIDAGARRVVVVRALTQARRPPEAASELRALLDAVPL